jgi:magnesium-protoporphyrin O-methyltransferase
MLDEALGRFDHIVAMDSLIHYREADVVSAIARLAGRAENSVLVTVAPRTPLLTMMHTAGKLFPRGDRSPAIQPIAPRRLGAAIGRTLPDWRVGLSERIDSGFYKSHALELVRR